MLQDWSAFHDLARAFAAGPVCLRIAGLTGAARALAVAELLQTPPRPALVLVPAVTDAHRWTQDLKFFGAPALEFPEAEPRLWRGGRHREADAERALVCRRLAAGAPVVVVATPAALDAEVRAPADFAAQTLRLAVGDSLDRELLLEAFERGGYERADTVVEVGQWSLRGGIVDVFSPSHASPARIEFFGDEIESIRLFDPTSQRSSERLDELLLLPLARNGAGSGRLLDYVPEDYRSHDDWGPQVIPEGYYFVMGDHRNNSSDSRNWGFVPKRYIIGKVQLRWWPMSAARLF